MNNVLAKIKKFFLILFCGIFFVFAIAMTILLLNFNKFGITQFGETSLIIINDRISSEIYKKGDLVLVEQVEIKNVTAGDELFAYQIDAKGNASVDLGKVGATHIDEDAIEYENGSTYSMEYVIGKSSKIYEDVGTFLSIIESKWGFLFIVLVPSFLIFVYEIYALVVEIKYGDEEE